MGYYNQMKRNKNKSSNIVWASLQNAQYFFPQAITLHVYIVTDKIWEIYTLSVI